MADVTISDLPPAEELAPSDAIELEKVGESQNASMHATLEQIAAFVADRIGCGSKGYSTINEQTGTAYTLVLADAGALVTMSNAAANTLTVPPDSDVAFPVGTRVDIGQDGAGQTIVVEGSGVLVRTPETLKLRKRLAKATLIKRAADTWDLEGNLEAAS